MSSMYGMVMPPNPELETLVVAAFTYDDGPGKCTTKLPKDLGRLRDAWLPEGTDTVCILHRNYGEDDVYTPEIEKTPNFVAYHSWEGDPTYAWWEFNLPKYEDVQKVMTLLRENLPQLQRHPMERFLEIVTNMNNPDHQLDPDVIRAQAAGEQIVAGLQEAMDSGEITEVTAPGGSVVIIPGEPFKDADA